VEWLVDYKPTCGRCKKIYKEREPPGDPPCETCRVLPAEENQDAITIFLLTKNQLILGFGGPVDVNHLAIWKAIEYYPEGVRVPWDCFNKVVRLSHWWLERTREKK